MVLEDRILSSGMQGTDVRKLHDALERLDFLIPPNERRHAMFGPGTIKAVRKVQGRHSRFASRVNGIVDQATANLIGMEAERYA